MMATDTADSKVNNETLVTLPGQILPCGDKYVTDARMTLHIRQKYYKYFKNSGRGFVFVNDNDETLFTVDTNTMGRHRTFEDSQGNPLFILDRHWTSFKKGWELRKESGEVIMSVSYNPFQHLHATMNIQFPQSGQQNTANDIEAPTASGTKSLPPIHIRANDLCGGDVNVSIGEHQIMMNMVCTNMPPGILSGYKITPPKWKADIAPGTDLALVAVLAVCVSDAFSEARIFMM